jgi:peptidoglycan/xylan/chitin deacetylase (PgdA/CDA1 family)
MYHGTPASEAGKLTRQLVMLKLFFEVVPLAELAAPSGKKGLRHRLALTFDDGLRSNVQVAYPILRSLGLPATFFVCPGLIERDGWLWNHEARQRLYSLPRDGFTALADALLAPREIEAFVEWMKTLKLGERHRIEAEVRAATPHFRPSEAQHEAFDLARWDELRQLDPRVVTIGSHTMTHPILTSLTPQEREDELCESRKALERELGRDVAFSAIRTATSTKTRSAPPAATTAAR